MSRRDRPPRLPRALLEAILPDGVRGASVLADLHEEYREWVAAHGETRARLRYTWEAGSLSAHFTVERLRRIAGRDGNGGGGTMDRMKNDVRVALRGFRRSPGFTAVAVLTMALGIGAVVSIFSVVNAVLLEPLPYDGPDELVALWEWNQPRDNRENVVNPGNYTAWRDRSESFAEMSAVSLAQPVTLEARGAPDEAMVQYAAPTFFRLLGIEAALGRTFGRGALDGEATEVVLSYRYWQRQFGGDPGVLDETIRLNGNPGVVVGVLPADYVIFGEGTAAWAAFDLERGDQTNTGRWLMVVGRLAEGRAIDAARDEMAQIAAQLQEEFPDFNAGWTVNLVPLKEQVVGDVRQALWILFGAVGLLLLIACANVANLFLVRATNRQRELAVRTSLGARGRTLAAQLLTESLLLALSGAVLGVGLAHLGTRAMATGLPDAFALPRVEAAGVDGPVLALAVALTVFTGLLFGLLPALQAARTSAAATLNAEGRGPSRGSIRTRNGLVVAEVALSTILLIGAGLFGRSMQTLLAVDPGVEPERVVVGRVNLPAARYPGNAARVAFFDDLLDRVQAVPGVEAVGGVTFLPMDGAGAGTSYWPDDRPAPPAEDRRPADIRNVSGDYFQAMGVSLLQGRTFDARDRADSPQTAIVNRALADLYWPDGDAIGRRVIINWRDETPWEIVGVVEDVRMGGLESEPREAIYLSYPNAPFFPWQHVTARTTRDAQAVVTGLRTALQEMDPALALGNVRMMTDIVGRSAARPRATALLMAVFAALATLLAAIGLYGVLSFTVAQRAREIGVRAAMGARPRDLLGMVVRQGTVLVGIGLVAGAGVALLGGRLVSALLFGIRPGDPLALGAAGVVLLMVGAAACIVPAWRAARVDPATALRSE